MGTIDICDEIFQVDENQSEMFLKKHVGLIHCENKLTLVQRKICNILLFNALESIKKEDIFQISLKKLCGLISYNSNDSNLIKNSVKALISTVMEWNLLEDSKFINADLSTVGSESWNASSLLAGASIKNGIISYSYSPQIKSVLSTLDIYGRINLFIQSKLNSVYSLVLYENCSRYKKINRTPWFSIALIKSIMGIPKNKYPEFKVLNRHVINVAVKEINEKSDIFVEAIQKKVGRSVTAIQFKISENEKYNPVLKRSNTKIKSLAHHNNDSLNLVLLNDFNLTEKQANKILASYQKEYISEKISFVKNKAKVKNKTAFLISSLEKDFKANSLNFKRDELEKVPEPTTFLRKVEDPSKNGFLQNKYMDYKINSYLDLLNLKNENEKNKILIDFEKSINNKKETVLLYKKFGINSPFIRASFIEFIDENFPELVLTCLSFEDYICSESH